MIKFLKNVSLVFVLFITFCGSNNQNKFLKIEHWWFSLDDFYSFVPNYTFKLLSTKDKQEKVNQFIERQLIIYDAIKKGHRNDPGFQKRMKNNKNQLLYNMFFDRTILDTIITKDLLLGEYENLNPVRKETYTFNEYLPVLKNHLSGTYEKNIRRAYITTIDNLITEYRLLISDSAIDSLAKEYFKKYKTFSKNNIPTSVSEIILRELDFKPALYSLNGTDLGVRDFLSRSKNYPYNIPSRLSHAPTLKTTIEKVIINDLIIKKSIKRKLDRAPDFKQKLLDKQYDLLYNSYKRNEISNKVDINNGRLKTFYEQNKNVLYMSKPLYEVHEIFIKDRKKAENVLLKAKQSPDYKSLSDKYTERFLNKPQKGYLGYITSDLYAGIGKCAKSTELGAVYPELVPSGKGFSIIKVLNIKKSEPSPFDTIKHRVLSDYKKSSYKSIELELIQSLRHKYTYEINVSLLNI
ncbi:MAG: peptidyl-prolyl cis-trans isomerase [Candidatus Marinimicrobia bacterium]|nr:peptidyl-prolyl cis-trans isomerase [Candidatus Neomarinimicrobiota bacterium]